MCSSKIDLPRLHITSYFVNKIGTNYDKICGKEIGPRKEI